MSSGAELLRVTGAALATALATGVLAIWLGSPQREPAPPAVPAPVADVPGAPGEAPAPAPVGAPPPATPPPERAPAPTAARPRAPVALPEPPPPEPLVTLDELMRLPRAAPPSEPERLDLAGEDAPDAEQERERARRFEVDYSRETLLRDVPTQPERNRTDVGVSVRVDEEDRLRLRGGVRVESKEGEEEREASPSVGVEVRF
jgi:hypothetical protein